MDNNEYILKTKTWIAKFVIQYDLCPFAKMPFNNDQIRYWIYQGSDLQGILTELASCFTTLLTTSPKELSNGFLILPSLGSDFKRLMEVIDYSNLLLEDMNLADQIQIVPFHPKFTFEDEMMDDPSNYVNRSPFPMIHILRSEEVSGAIDLHPNISQVSERNKSLLKNLPSQDFLKLLELLIVK